MQEKSKNITLFGSTGFVGQQTLEVISHLGLNVVAITANKNVAIIERQIRKFKPKYALMTDERAAKVLKLKIRDSNTKILCGKSELCNPDLFEESNIVVNSIVGIAGLLPSVCALAAKKTLALANKESLVVAGKILTSLAKKNCVKILPIDSEHSAILQCLNSKFSDKFLKKIILTASGGPFFGKKREELLNVSVAQAMKHPTWSMGNKITIDSATMMNKGFELIEAHWLFNVEVQSIDVLIHRESIIHSLVEFADNSLLANLAVPDMKLPIQYALTYPERYTSLVKHLNLYEINQLTFYKPTNFLLDALNLCKNALIAGGSLPVVVNAANELAVDLFLRNKILFLGIIEIVKFICTAYKNSPINNIDDVLNADDWTKNFANSNLDSFVKYFK